MGVSYLIAFFIFILVIVNARNSAVTCTIEGDNAKTGVCSYDCSSMSPSVTAIIIDENIDVSYGISNHRKVANVCKFDYEFSTGLIGGIEADVLISVENVGTFLVQSVKCIFEDVLIQTKEPKYARDIVLGDKFVQLDGSFRRVKNIFKSYANETMYQYEGAIVTQWHPVRLPHEKHYRVAKYHEHLTPVHKKGFVYNFELESFKDDILFVDSSLIAESLNDLPNNVPLDRS